MGHSKAYQVVDVLREIGGKSLGLEDAEDLVSGDESDLGNSVAVPEDDADLGRGQTLLGQLEDLLLDVVGGQLQPGGDCAAERQSRLGNTLARCVHTTHDGGLVYLKTKRRAVRVT